MITAKSSQIILFTDFAGICILRAMNFTSVIIFDCHSRELEEFLQISQTRIQTSRFVSGQPKPFLFFD
jgi:hypothetical protein